MPVSSAAYRVRIALNLKGIAYERATIQSDQGRRAAAFGGLQGGQSARVDPDARGGRSRDRAVAREAHLFRNIPLQQNTTEGGKLFMHYTLKPVRVKLK